MQQTGRHAFPVSGCVRVPQNREISNTPAVTATLLDSVFNQA